jgi:hypothetical protein
MLAHIIIHADKMDAERTSLQSSLNMNMIRLIVILAGLLHAGGVFAQKTDIVILENGDRITGEIKRLEAGLLSFSTDTMGTVNIEWRFIRRIISDKTQSMEMTDGTRLIGQLQKPEDSDEVAVLTDSGPITINIRQIVSAWPVQASFKDRMDLDISLGFDYQKATGNTDLTTAIDFRTTNVRRMTYASWRGNVTRSRDGAEQTRYELTGNHEYLLADQRFRSWFGRVESNDALGVNLRLSAGGALGKYLLKTNNTWFSLSGGLMATEEIPEEGDSETNLEAVGNLRWRYFRFADPERSLDTNFSVLPSLTDWGRYRANLRTTLKIEVINDLFWSLELWGNYDNKPININEETEKLDYGVTTSVGWSY